MIWAAALSIVAAFMALLIALGVPRRAAAIVARSRQALADIRSVRLSDEQKERAVQQHAVVLSVAFLLVTALSGAALAVPLAVVWLADRLGVVDFEAVMAATVSWPVLAIATALGLLVFALRRRPT